RAGRPRYVTRASRPPSSPLQRPPYPLVPVARLLHNTVMTDQPLPSMPNDLIQTPAELQSLCDHLRQAGTFTFDTEFIGETSYTPILCLVQVATTDRVGLIDPFALKDLKPLWDLMADPAIRKVCHAGDQDLAIVFQQGGVQSTNIFDSQLGAGFIGLGYPLAYWRQVDHFCGVELEKAHTFSAWDRRPLSKQQFQYAIDDVRYLPIVYDRITARLESLNRGAWMAEACNDLCVQAARRTDPERVYIKIKGYANFDPRQLAVLRAVAALREQLAFEHNLPPRTMLRDEVLLDIATRMPRSEIKLAAIRSLPREELQSYGREILEAVVRRRSCPDD
ncbi:MAG: HRDC domain-containing protein, partial [Phycisphaerae bacterium]